MLESEAFKTYRAYATGEKDPKSKATKKKTESKSSPKTKPSQASKEQMKLATKRSLTEFYVSHASGLGNGLDLQSKVPDEQQQTRSGTNEGADDDEHDSDDDNEDNDDEDDDQDNDSERTESDNDGDDFVHPKLSTYRADDQEEENEDEKANDDEDQNQEDEDYVMGGEQEDEEDEELYTDLNINLNRRDAEMTDAQVNQETGEVHVTLTTEPPVVQQQSSSVSSDLVSKFINPSPDTDSKLLHPFRALKHRDPYKSDLLTKQTNQFAEALSSIPGIVDKYLATKMKDTVDVAVQLKSDKLRKNLLAENQDFLNSLDSNMKRIIKEQVKAQTSKIMTKVEKYVTETLGAEVLVRSTNQPQTSYAVASSLSELELKRFSWIKWRKITLLTDPIEDVMIKTKMKNPPLDQIKGRSDKDQARKSHQKKQLKRSQSLQVLPKVTNQSPPNQSASLFKKRAWIQGDDLEEPFHSEFDNRKMNDCISVREQHNVDERLWNPSGSQTPDHKWNKTKTDDGP
ncbi:hypothetical protein Tco_0281122 [Tanacetum coccineum]